MITENGIYNNVPRAEYERIPRVNISRLVNMKRSPFHFRASELEESESTDAKVEGSASHVAVLEPQRWLASYAIWDGGTRRGKDWDKFRADNSHLEILTAAQRDRVKAIQKAVHGDERAAKYLRDGSAEVTLLWTDSETGIECKGRIDFANECITDLKTTRDASPDAFARQCWDLDYHVRSAFYSDGYAATNGGEVLPYRIVAVDNRAPHAVAVYRIPERILDVGRATYQGWLAKLLECRTRNWWPSYADGQELELEMPRWARPPEEDTDVENLVEVEGAHG